MQDDGMDAGARTLPVKLGNFWRSAHLKCIDFREEKGELSWKRFELFLVRWMFCGLFIFTLGLVEVRPR